MRFSLLFSLIAVVSMSARAMADDVEFLHEPNKPDSWQFEQHEDADASLDADGDALKLVVKKTSSEMWHVQFYQDPFTLVEGQTYTVKFRAKAEGDQSYSIVLGTDEDDYHAVGDEQTFKVGKDWKDYEFQFKVHDTSPNHVRGPTIMAGQTKGAMWIANMSLKGPAVPATTGPSTKVSMISPLRQLGSMLLAVCQGMLGAR